MLLRGRGTRGCFLIYASIGLPLAIFSWYFPSTVDALRLPGWTGLLLNQYVLWLVPAIPVAVHEAQVSRSGFSSALAVVALWLTTTLVFYLYYLCLAQLHILPQIDSAREMWYSVSRDFVRWSVVALVGGFCVGFVTGSIYLHFANLRSPQVG